MTISHKMTALYYLTKNYWGLELFSASQSILWGVLFWLGSQVIRDNSQLGIPLGLFFVAFGALQLMTLFWTPQFRATFSLISTFKWAVLALFLYQERGIGYESLTTLVLAVFCAASNISNSLRGVQGRLS